MPKSIRSGVVHIGLLCSEPLQIAGILSAFEFEAGIVIVAGELHVLTKNLTLSHVILCVERNSKHSQVSIETQLLIYRLRPDLVQIVIGPMEEDGLVMRSISAGARAYLDIQAGPEETREAIRVVLDGSIWATRRMLALLVDRLLNTPGVRVPEGPSEFSPREHQVMDLILRACSNREIAEELQIGERTVKGHVASLLRKTGTDNRVSLSVRVRQGLLYQRRFGEKE